MLRKWLVLTLSVLSLQAAALNVEFLPAQSGPEKEFRSLMESGNFHQALLVWTTAHGDSKFGMSDTGIATWSYLLLQNGLPFKAIETLVNNTQPKSLDKALLALWTTELKGSVFVQKGWIPMTAGWKKINDNSQVVLKLKSKKDIAKAFASAQALPKDNVNQKARVWWQIATLAPQINDVDSALKALKLIRESGQIILSLDQINMTYARVLYQKGEIDAALNAYAQIPKGSLYWVDSVEEKAWAQLRQDNFDQAMGTITTALSPALVSFTGPESYFLSNLMSLKVCDYPRIFQTSDLFKKRHRPRLLELQELSKNGTNKGINQAIERMDQKGVNLDAAANQIESLPHNIFHDRAFIRAVETRRELLTEMKKARELNESVKAMGDNHGLENILLDARTEANRQQKLALQRARTLATEELGVYRKIMNKMHIVEAEVIQRLHVDDSLQGERGKLAKADDKGEVLVFPYSSDEVWMDELDNYKAQVKDCPTLKGASL